MATPEWRKGSSATPACSISTRTPAALLTASSNPPPNAGQPPKRNSSAHPSFKNVSPKSCCVFSTVTQTVCAVRTASSRREGKDARSPLMPPARASLPAQVIDLLLPVQNFWKNNSPSNSMTSFYGFCWWLVKLKNVVTKTVVIFVTWQETVASALPLKTLQTTRCASTAVNVATENVTRSARPYRTVTLVLVMVKGI